MVMMQPQVGLAKNVEECMEFASEGGKVVVSATPRCCSSQTHGVELSVVLQALEVSCTAKICSGLLHHGLRSPVNTITIYL
jgi:centromere/kinetochore protein ZW10